MTVFAAALKLTGLSHEGAARRFGFSVDAVRSWSCGRSPVPQWIWEELKALWALQRLAAVDPDRDLGNWRDEGVAEAVEAMRTLHTPISLGSEFHG